MESMPDPEIDARLQLVVSRAHRALTGEELAVIRMRIADDIDNRNQMRTLSLTNNDAPDSGFSPVAAEETRAS